MDGHFKRLHRVPLPTDITALGLVRVSGLSRDPTLISDPHKEPQGSFLPSF